MNLIIDQGNTLIKIAVFNKENEILHQYTTPNGDLEIEFLIDTSHKFSITHTIISSVIKNEDFIFHCQKNLPKPILLNSQTKVPFINKYETPKTLGFDRIALAAAATRKFPNENVLVVDAGTCITFDFITSKGEFLGGAISPGIQMRLKAMHAFTSRLPLLENTDFDISDFIGKNTKNCMLSGVYNNIIQEIEGIHSQYKTHYKNLTLVLTGGDHVFLAKNIKSRIFVNSYFLLEGLNAILEHNKTHE